MPEPTHSPSLHPAGVRAWGHQPSEHRDAMARRCLLRDLPDAIVRQIALCFDIGGDLSSAARVCRSSLSRLILSDVLFAQQHWDAQLHRVRVFGDQNNQPALDHMIRVSPKVWNYLASFSPQKWANIPFSYKCVICAFEAVCVKSMSAHLNIKRVKSIQVSLKMALRFAKFVLNQSTQQSDAAFTCFLWAADRDWMPVADLLVTSGRIHKSTEVSEALSICCIKKWSHLALRLLSVPHADLGGQFNACLVMACENNLVDVAKLLVAHPSVTLSRKSLYWCFVQAMENACLEMVQFLLGLSKIALVVADPNILKLAAMGNHRQTLALLLQHPCVNPAGQEMALWDACIVPGHLDIVRIFLADGRLDPWGPLVAPLFLAIDNNQTEIVRLLLSRVHLHPRDSKKHILNSFVFKATTCNPDILRLFLNHSTADQLQLEKILWTQCIERAPLDRIQDLLRLHLLDPRIQDLAPLRLAIAAPDARAPVLNLLLQDARLAQPKVQPRLALLIKDTLRAGNAAPRVLEMLLAHAHARPRVGWLRAVALTGRVDALRVYLRDPRLDPRALDVVLHRGVCVGLVAAAVEGGCGACLEVVLEDGRADPCAGRGHAVRVAVGLRIEDALERLIVDGRIVEVLWVEADVWGVLLDVEVD